MAPGILPGTFVEFIRDRSPKSFERDRAAVGLYFGLSHELPPGAALTRKEWTW